MYESSSLFALFWNVAWNQLSKDVKKEFELWLHDSQMVRMDTKWSQSTVQGVYTIRHGDDSFLFHGVEMPLPSGFFGRNYARFVRPMSSIIYLASQMFQAYTERRICPQI